jgi:glycosyltransferase involved in cell wall biosynthesis
MFRWALAEAKKGVAMHFTIGICAYNEEATIGLLLEEIRLQDYGNNVLDEVLICLDGCTDRTSLTVKEFAKIEPRLRVFINPTRRGRAVSLTTLLKNSRGEVFVGIDADVRVPRLPRLLNLFNNTDAVAVVPRGIPYKRRGVGPRLYEIMWCLHHLVCQKSPKISSGCNAFKPLIREIPAQIISCDSYLQVRLQKLGRIVYMPDVHSYTEPPRGLRQFLAQRHRWVMAQVQITKLSKSAPPTYKIENAFPHLPKVFFKDPIVCTLLMFLELIVRAKARVDFRLYGPRRVMSYSPLGRTFVRCAHSG